MDIDLFAKRLKELRTENNMYLEHVANKVGVSLGLISHYENAKRTPSRETVTKLAKLFKVDIEYLLGTSNHRSIEYKTAKKILLQLVEMRLLKKDDDGMYSKKELNDIIKKLNKEIKK